MFYTTKTICITDKTDSPDEVYIGRKGQGQDGYYGNPVVKKSLCPECGVAHSTNGSTLKCYEIYLKKKLASDLTFRKKVKKLLNKTLVCHCKESSDCHGSVLVRYINALN
jgi:hypothetical protein